MRRIIPLLLLTLSVIVPTALLGSEDTPAETLPEFNELMLDGRAFGHSELAGKVVFMNFWAPWCKPCIEEMPELHKVYERLKDNDRVVVLAVHTGWAEEPIEKVRSFVAEKGYTIPVVYDQDGSLRQAFDNGGIPRNYVMDADGKVRFAVEPRPLATFVERAASRVESLLKE